MVDEEAGAGVAAEGGEEGGAGGGVEVVGGFVEGEESGGAPEGDRDLQALAFAVGKGVPAGVPVVADVEVGADLPGVRVVGREEGVEPFGGIVGALDNVQAGGGAGDGAVGGGEFAGAPA